MTYREFIDSKLLAKTNNVLNIDESELNNTLFDYQKDLVVYSNSERDVGNCKKC